MTSWGICDVVLLGAVTAEGDVVLAVVPAREGDGLSASTPMELAAMQATRTVTLDLDGYRVRDQDVAASSRSRTGWPSTPPRPRTRAPHTFGLQRESCGAGRDGVSATTAGGRARAAARARGGAPAAVASTLIDDVPRSSTTTGWRARASLSSSCARATALVGDRRCAMADGRRRSGSDAGASFHLVQAQTGRSARPRCSCMGRRR
jgi:hypothetical protein